MDPLSPRQRDVLRFLVGVVDEQGRFPSVREIGRRLGVSSPATVKQHLEALEAKGYLARRGDKLVLVPAVREEQGVPVVGRIAAGAPILAEEHLEGRLRLPEFFGPREGTFAVRVQGDSMEEAGIHHGDVVVVRQQPRVRDGEICVAYLGEEQEATVKVFKRRSWGVELQPRNPRHRPIAVTPEKDPFFRIGGKVVGVVRRLA